MSFRWEKIHYKSIIFHDMDLEDCRRLLELHKVTQDSQLDHPASFRNAILRAMVILIVARLEAYIEDVFEWSASRIFSDLNKDEIRDFYKQTSKRFNNPTTENINRLFLAIGISNVLANLKWRGCSSDVVMKSLNELVEMRHSIAHGKLGGMVRADRRFSVTATEVKKWLRLVENFFYVFEETVSNILIAKGIKPSSS